MFDKLDRKIRQMHAALAGLATDNLSTIQPEITVAYGHRYTRIDFNRNRDPIALANAASLLIANIASIKDYLKVWCRERNVPFEGDVLINSNRSVALIHDLWNMDKHGELNMPRSGHKPHLTDIQTSLQLTCGTGGAFLFVDPNTGKITTGAGDGGAVELVLDAKIADEAGNVLGDFTKTCIEAVEAWSNALSAAGVPLP